MYRTRERPLCDRARRTLLAKVGRHLLEVSERDTAIESMDEQVAHARSH
jgi:hypothetical protein